MKTAILLYGYMRTYKITSKSLLKNVVEPNNADIFVYCWDNEGVSNVKTNTDVTNINKYKNEMSIKEDTQGYDVTYDTLKNIYGPKLKKASIQRYDINKFKQDSCGVLSPILPIERMYSLYYNITGIMNLLLQYEQETGIQYDNIILARPDLEFYSEINLKDYDLDCLNIANYGGNINPNGQNDLYYTCYYKNIERIEYIPACTVPFSDQLIISNHDNMLVLANLYEMLEEYNKRCLPVCHPETVLYYHLAMEKNLKVKTNNIRYEILRSNYCSAENIFTTNQRNMPAQISKKEKYKNKVKSDIQNIKVGTKSLFGVILNEVKYLIMSIRNK